MAFLTGKKREVQLNFVTSVHFRSSYKSHLQGLKGFLLQSDVRLQQVVHSSSA